MASPLRESFTSGTYARRPTGIPVVRDGGRSWQVPGEEWQCCRMGSRMPRLFTDTKEGHSEWYVHRFRTAAAEGTDITGEARLLDAIVPPRSRILDAGSG